MTSEQGLVERWKLVGVERYKTSKMITAPDGSWVAYSDHLAALEAQSAQIAELQAHNAWAADHDDKLINRLRGEIADLKRALDTARNDALEEAAKVADAAEAQQEIDHGSANTGGAAAAAAAIRALQPKDQSHGA